MQWARRRALRLPEHRRDLVVLALGLLAVLYAAPLLVDASSAAGERTDRFLRLAAVTLLAVACLAASWRHEGRVRSALLVLLAGLQVWAVAQSVLVARDVLALGDPLPIVDAAGVVALTGCAAGALWLLAGPRTRVERGPMLVEWALVATSVVVLLRLAVPVFWQAGQSAADWARAAGVGALLAAALLLVMGRPSAPGGWTWLPGGLAAVAVSLAAADSSLPGQGGRVAGFLLAACLVVLAAQLVRESDAPPPAADGVRSRLRGSGALAWVLPAAATAALVVHLVALRRVDLVGLGGLVVVGLLAVAHGQLLGLQARGQLAELHAREDGLRHRAFHDDLTGLANRALFLDGLARALDLHRRHRLPVSVLYLDLDGFKAVNDEHGHAVGDEVLSALADRLRLCVRPEDTLARLGGDEFALLLEHASSSEAVEQRLHAALQEPFVVGDLLFSLSMSVGSARVDPSDDTPSPEEVLARADVDMYADKAQRARSGSRGRASSPADDEAVCLAAGIAAGELSLVHQLLVDAVTGEVQGTEALARWRRSGRLLLPASFLHVAERNGLSGALLDEVLRQACAQLATWSRAAGHDRLRVWVNVSPAQLDDPELPRRVATAVQAHGLQQHQVVLEVSVAALGATTQALLRTDGPPLALTGFTGAPEQLALLALPAVRAVKVEGSALLGGDRRVHVLAALAPELGVQVVVERVQRLDELSALRGLPGVLGQGYALSRPAAAVDLDPVVLGRTPLLV